MYSRIDLFTCAAWESLPQELNKYLDLSWVLFETEMVVSLIAFRAVRSKTDLFNMIIFLLNN